MKDGNVTFARVVKTLACDVSCMYASGYLFCQTLNAKENALQ